LPDSANRLIIAGAGQAGYWVAATVRQLQPNREIVLVGEESSPPYERPPLSKGLLTGDVEPESTWFKPPDYYSESRIDLRLGTRVEAIDRAARTVTLSDGVCEPYGTLVLATGLRPRPLPVPGSDHPGLLTLRTLADAEAIHSGIGPAKNIVAIGAGFIGLEVAAAAINMGCSVTVIEAQNNALGRVMAPEVSAALVLRHEQAGVAFRFGETVTHIGDDKGNATVHLGSGDAITADLVLVGIGGVPCDEIARAAGIACDDGILVAETGLTSDPRVYAVGDVCRQFSVALGRRIRLESWQNAQNQAISVGRRIAGDPETYGDLPWFWTDQYQDNFQIIGVPESWDGIVWRGEPGDGKFTAIYLKDGLVVGGNTLNNARDIRPLKQLILDRVPVPPEALADMSTSLINIQKQQAAK
jgi:3-phenylpropionate/trans-cinnamate dioxygenase ferredoxin reductase subunit